MKQYKRAMHFDFHTMPGIENILADFDAEKFAKTLKDCHVEFINFPARCNIGFSYYKTKVGTMYPGLDRDILGEVISACHKQGIGVCAYINGGLNHELAAHRYDLCRVDKDGAVTGDVTENFYRTLCLNSDYINYLISEINEILTYDIDGLFVDCLITRNCYCPKCMQKMKAEGVDTNNDDEVNAYQQRLVYKTYDILKSLVKDDIYFYINSNMSIPGIHTHAEVECLPTSKLWGTDFFQPMSSYQRTRFDKLVYMTGRFQDCWGDFGGLKTLESLQNDMYDALMAGYDFNISDHLHPIHGLFGEIADRVKIVFEEKMRYEPFLENPKYLSEIGVIVNEEYWVSEYTKGVARMLNELKLPYSTYRPYDDFSNEKLIIIPKKLNLNSETAKKIIDFKNNGGKILFVGTAIDNATELGLDYGIKDIEDDKFDNSYYKTEDCDMIWATYAPAKVFKNNGKTELAKHVSGIFNFTYDGNHSYFYRPQGKASDHSAVVTDGEIAYVCFNAFDGYAESFLKETKLLIKDTIDSLLPEKMVECNLLPSTAIISLTGHENHKVLHLKTTYPAIKNGRGIIEEHTYLPKADFSVKGEYKVYALPSCVEIPATHQDGRTIFTATDILGYSAFMLK